jgi:hypothetical protein
MVDLEGERYIGGAFHFTQRRHVIKPEFSSCRCEIVRLLVRDFVTVKPYDWIAAKWLVVLNIFRE